jgi:hypothetical protein
MSANTAQIRRSMGSDAVSESPAAACDSRDSRMRASRAHPVNRADPLPAERAVQEGRDRRAHRLIEQADRVCGTRDLDERVRDAGPFER